jgi:UDP-glucose 4-epimerase
VRSVVELMAAESAVAGVFNIGSDETITILELAQRVVLAVNPSLAIEFQTYHEAYDDEQFEDVRARVPDLTRLRDTIGFRPEHDLDNAIRDVIAYTRMLLRR